MPPLVEPSGLAGLTLSSDLRQSPLGVSRSPVSLRVRSRGSEFGEGIWQSDYAATYAGGETSWLRIESQLQHMEELVDVPDLENGAASTVVVDAG
jgi:hypothetical protein